MTCTIYHILQYFHSSSQTGMHALYSSMQILKPHKANGAHIIKTPSFAPLYLGSYNIAAIKSNLVSTNHTVANRTPKQWAVMGTIADISRTFEVYWNALNRGSCFWTKIPFWMGSLKCVFTLSDESRTCQIQLWISVLYTPRMSYFNMYFKNVFTIELKVKKNMPCP